VYFYAGRYDESISQFRKILEQEPNFVWVHIYLAHNYAMKGMFAEANSHADKVESLSPSVYRYVGCDYAKSGEKEKARKILGQLLDPSNEGAFDHITIATIYVGLDEKEKAFYWLNKGYEARSGLMVYLKAYGQTFLKNLSSDPRYNELLKKMGFEK
jgi:tetratricopeptide (TPR) repeat protein